MEKIGWEKKEEERREHDGAWKGCVLGALRTCTSDKGVSTAHCLGE